MFLEIGSRCPAHEEFGAQNSFLNDVLVPVQGLIGKLAKLRPIWGEKGMGQRYWCQKVLGGDPSVNPSPARLQTVANNKVKRYVHVSHVVCKTRLFDST